MSRVLGERQLHAATCGRCSRPIWFVRTETGKSMPLDWDPDPKGNAMLYELDERLYSRTLGKGAERPADTVVWMPHAATCGRAPAGAMP